MTARTLPAVAAVEGLIVLLRGSRVMLSHDLAALYGVETRVLMQAVKRNPARFPADFMFRLTAEEARNLKSQTVTSSAAPVLRSQIVTSKQAPERRGGTRYAPHAFTEQGVAMLSSVLHSPRAVSVNVEIMRAFVRLRGMLAGNKELARKIAALESKYDAQFKAVFDAIYRIMGQGDTRKKRRIGFLS